MDGTIITDYDTIPDTGADTKLTSVAKCNNCWGYVTEKDAYCGECGAQVAGDTDLSMYAPTVALPALAKGW